jgi:hypothetical protein
MICTSIDDEWNQFLTSTHTPSVSTTKQKEKMNPIKHISLKDDKKEPEEETKEIPKCEELYISTKTKVVFLNYDIDIQRVFWNIPIIEYWKPIEGVVKKQIKIVSKTVEEFQEYKKRLEDVPYYTETISKQIDNPNARRIKFKDERKITVGISKKDIMNHRGKVKNAFYNCFAIIMRFFYEDVFREIHVKVFNTGKMEIPGILNNTLLEKVKQNVISLIQPFYPDQPLHYIENKKDENILINSNFNCGFYINRDKLHSILSKKYGIETSYDPCSYPGVKCKFYYNNEMEEGDGQQGMLAVEDRSQKMHELLENKKYTEISFMVFRTGSCLIVGNCSERILMHVFTFIRRLLQKEHGEIAVANDETVAKVKKTKMRKRVISLSSQYYKDNIEEEE